MGTAICIGVGGKAANVKDMYIGVGGVARKVKAGWIGVGGKAKLFWDGGNIKRLGYVKLGSTGPSGSTSKYIIGYRSDNEGSNWTQTDAQLGTAASGTVPKLSFNRTYKKWIVSNDKYTNGSDLVGPLTQITGGPKAGKYTVELTYLNDNYVTATVRKFANWPTVSTSTVIGSVNIPVSYPGTEPYHHGASLIAYASDGGNRIGLLFQILYNDDEEEESVKDILLYNQIIEVGNDSVSLVGSSTPMPARNYVDTAWTGNGDGVRCTQEYAGCRYVGNGKFMYWFVYNQEWSDSNISDWHFSASYSRIYLNDSSLGAYRIAASYPHMTKNYVYCKLNGSLSANGSGISTPSYTSGWYRINVNASSPVFSYIGDTFTFTAIGFTSEEYIYGTSSSNSSRVSRITDADFTPTLIASGYSNLTSMCFSSDKGTYQPY